MYVFRVSSLWYVSICTHQLFHYVGCFPRQFAYDIIDKRTADSNAEKKANGGEKGEAATDLLSLYTALRDEKGQALGREALRDSGEFSLRDPSASIEGLIYLQFCSHQPCYRRCTSLPNSALTSALSNSRLALPFLYSEIRLPKHYPGLISIFYQALTTLLTCAKKSTRWKRSITIPSKI